MKDKKPARSTLARTTRRSGVFTDEERGAMKDRVQELKAALDRGERPFVVDLRHRLEFLVNPRTVSTAVRISPDELPLRHAEIPRDREVVLYCTCPSEATSAKVAMDLKKIGIIRVRPLMGGLQAWENEGYPLDEFYPEEEAKAVS